mmetsp:Transcript_12874/g.29206  ORF Transcript_12874/g.29206 Transcript_12874/m.29206 type:complete len:252 (+) Transcript_12874:1276-2031(+)
MTRWITAWSRLPPCVLSGRPLEGVLLMRLTLVLIFRISSRTAAEESALLASFARLVSSCLMLRTSSSNEARPMSSSVAWLDWACRGTASAASTVRLAKSCRKPRTSSSIFARRASGLAPLSRIASSTGEKSTSLRALWTSSSSADMSTSALPLRMCSMILETSTWGRCSLMASRTGAKFICSRSFATSSWRVPSLASNRWSRLSTPTKATGPLRFPGEAGRESRPLLRLRISSTMRSRSEPPPPALDSCWP